MVCNIQNVNIYCIINHNDGDIIRSVCSSVMILSYIVMQPAIVYVLPCTYIWFLHCHTCSHQHWLHVNSVLVMHLNVSWYTFIHCNMRSHDMNSLKYTTNVMHTVVEIGVRNWLAIFLKMGHFVGYWWPSHWKCTVNLANQNGFWLAQCWNWSENGQWPAVTSSAHDTAYLCLH